MNIFTALDWFVLLIFFGVLGYIIYWVINPNLACCAITEYNTFSVKIQANNGKKLYKNIILHATSKFIEIEFEELFNDGISNFLKILVNKSKHIVNT